MLEAEELKRRIEAARTLRGLKQTELAALLAEDGLGKSDLGRIERGDMTMQRIHRDAIARHLGVPDEWLTEPDVDTIVRPASPTQLDRLEAMLAAVVAHLGIELPASSSLVETDEMLKAQAEAKRRAREHAEPRRRRKK